MFECKVCGKKFKKITHSHLKSHGTTMTEYKEKFGKEGLILNDCLFTKRCYSEVELYKLERKIEVVAEKRKRGHKVGSRHHWQ